MPEGFFNYFFLISFSGYIYLLFLSILSFTNNESLKIASNKHTNSGVMLLVNSFVYGAIALFLKVNQKKKYIKALAPDEPGVLFQDVREVELEQMRMNVLNDNITAGNGL